MKNRDEGLYYATFFYSGVMVERVFPFDPLVYRVTGIFLVLLPAWLSKRKGITRGRD